MPLWLFFLSAALCATPLPRLAHAGFTLSLQNGALTVARVLPNSNAQRAGLLPGDTLQFDPAAARSLLRRPHGTELPLSLLRAGQPLRLTLTYLAPPREDAPGIDIEYGELLTHQHRRRTIRTAPRKTIPRATILWLAGSGCDSQESPNGDSPHVQLLYALTRAGYATLRIEKTGVGDSEGPPCYSPQGDLFQEIRAYTDAIAQLRPAKIILFGHSAGATLVPLVLRQSGPVHAAILAGGMGSRFFDYMLEMRDRQTKSNPAEMAIHRRCLEALLIQHQSPDEIEAAQPDCRRRVRFDSPPAYIAQWAKLDLREEWSALPKLPVLVFYGTADEVTSRQQSTLLQSHIPGARLRILPMDHDFLQRAKLHPGVARVTLQFLKRTGARSYP